jgi:hypothetical protein
MLIQKQEILQLHIQKVLRKVKPIPTITLTMKSIYNVYLAQSKKQFLTKRPSPFSKVLSKATTGLYLLTVRPEQVRHLQWRVVIRAKS